MGRQQMGSVPPPRWQSRGLPPSRCCPPGADTASALSAGSPGEESGIPGRSRSPSPTPSQARLLNPFWPPDASLRAISLLLFQAGGLDLLPLWKKRRNKEVWCCCLIARPAFPLWASIHPMWVPTAARPFDGVKQGTGLAPQAPRALSSALSCLLEACSSGKELVSLRAFLLAVATGKQAADDDEAPDVSHRLGRGHARSSWACRALDCTLFV